MEGVKQREILKRTGEQRDGASHRLTPDCYHGWKSLVVNYPQLYMYI